MQLKNDANGRNTLRETVLNHYERKGKKITAFLRSTTDDGWRYEHYLLDGKYVFKYGIGVDRNSLIGGICLAIGPHYFGPADFWDYPNSERFSMEASTEAVERNLCLLDEFLRYRADE